MTTGNPTTQQGLIWLGIALFAAVIAATLGYYYPGEGHDPIVGALYWTGRLAFLVFLVPLFARPLRQLVRTDFTATLMRWRRNAGIVYGGIQTVHLVIVCSLFLLVANPPTETIMVIVGSAGLTLSIAMLITSFPGPTKALGRKLWKWVHKAGFYVFMFIYFYDFVIEPLMLDRPASYLLWASLTLSGMVVRTIVIFKRNPITQAAQ